MHKTNYELTVELTKLRLENERLKRERKHIDNSPTVKVILGF